MIVTVARFFCACVMAGGMLRAVFLLFRGPEDASAAVVALLLAVTGAIVYYITLYTEDQGEEESDEPEFEEEAPDERLPKLCYVSCVRCGHQQIMWTPQMTAAIICTKCGKINMAFPGGGDN